MKLILILVNIMKKIQVDNNGKKYILLRIDVYFTKIEIDEKGHTDRDLIFEQKRQEALEKKLNCTFIRINTSRENFGADYEASEIQAFISNFNKNKIKEKDNKNKELKDENNKLKDENKELKDETEKLKLLLENLSVKNNDVNDKK